MYQSILQLHVTIEVDVHNALGHFRVHGREPARRARALERAAKVLELQLYLGR